MISFDKFNPESRFGRKAFPCSARQWLRDGLSKLTWSLSSATMHLREDSTNWTKTVRHGGVQGNPYYLPTLSSKLTQLRNNATSGETRIANNPILPAMISMGQKPKHELAQFPDNKFPEVDRLEVGKFDSATYVKTARFLNLLKEYYTVKSSNATKVKGDGRLMTISAGGV